MLKLELKVDLGRSADQVWEIVGNFNGFPAWHPFVKESRLEPAAGSMLAA